MSFCLKNKSVPYVTLSKKNKSVFYVFPYVTLSKNMSYVTLSKNFPCGSHKKKSPHIENSFSGAYEIRTRDLLRDRQAF